MVGGCRTLCVDDQIVILRSATRGYGKAIAELDPLHRRNGKEQVGHPPLHRVEQRLTPAAANSLDAGLDDAAHRVTLGTRCGNHLVETIRALLRTNGTESRSKRNALGQDLLGHHTGRHQRHGQAGREVTTPSRIVETVILIRSHPIGMRRAAMVAQPRIVLRVRVVILKQYGQRSTRRMALVEPRKNGRAIRLTAGCSSRSSPATTRQIGFKILRREGYAGRNAIQRDTDCRPMRFAKDGQSKSETELIHG